MGIWIEAIKCHERNLPQLSKRLSRRKLVLGKLRTYRGCIYYICFDNKTQVLCAFPINHCCEECTPGTLKSSKCPPAWSISGPLNKTNNVLAQLTQNSLNQEIDKWKPKQIAYVSSRFVATRLGGTTRSSVTSKIIHSSLGEYNASYPVRLCKYV